MEVCDDCARLDGQWPGLAPHGWLIPAEDNGSARSVRDAYLINVYVCTRCQARLRRSTRLGAAGSWSLDPGRDAA